VYLVGIRINQIDKGRDPVTLSLSADGVAWGRHWAVHYDGRGLPISHGDAVARTTKGRRRAAATSTRVHWSTPSGALDTEMVVSYSVGKEDIALTR
jgi:hypothetical protein